MSNTENKAFTLAEILITIVIIGVIATLILPLIITKVEDFQYKTAYKRAYRQVSLAFESIRSKYSFISTGNSFNDGVKNSFIFLDEYKKMFITTKYCTATNCNDCWDYSGEEDIWGWPYENSWNSEGIIDNTGMALVVSHSALAIDLNGKKKPNQWGRDRFKIVPSPDTSYFLENTTKLIPVQDNLNTLCGPTSTNKCKTEQNYYGTSWLYN